MLLYRINGFYLFLLAIMCESYVLHRKRTEYYPQLQDLFNPDEKYIIDPPVPSLEVYVDPDLMNYPFSSPDDYGWHPDFRPIIEAVENADNEVDVDIVETLSSGSDRDIPLGIPDEELNVPGEPLTPKDFANAKNIDLQGPVLDEYSPDPIQSAGLFEGDIAGVNISDIINPTRNAIKNLNLRWISGMIPYAISQAFNQYERAVIAAAFQDYHDQTCIRFVPRSYQKDYVYLVKGSGCSSQVGRFGGGQQISLGPGCAYKGVVIHELMHAVGFWHEQSRPDRDSFVYVLWQNIIPGMEYNFQKHSWAMTQSLGVTYDTSSVMHYTSLSFSRDGRSPTIVPRQSGVKFIGQRVGFSNKDVQKINNLYQCSPTGVTIKPEKPKPPVEGKCGDNHRLCSYWANINECAKNPSWMLVNCKKSCKQCPAGCKDHNKDCPYWAGIGECKKNPSYMTVYCALSCNTCKYGSDNEIS